MSKKSYSSEVLIPLITILSDAIAIQAAFLVSFWLRFTPFFLKLVPLPEGIDKPELQGYIILSLMIIPIWLLIFQSRKMYRPRRVVFIFDEFFLIARLVTFGIIFAFGLIFFYRVFPYSRFVFLLIWAASILFITLGRYIVIKIEKNLYSKGKTRKNAIIIGNNTSAFDIYNNFTKHTYAGYNITGYLEDDNRTVENFMEGKNKLGTYSQIFEIAHQNKTDTFLIAIPSSENEKLYNMMRICEGENFEFLLLPDFLEMITSSVRVQEIDNIPFLKIKSIPMSIWNRILKRTFDLIFSGLILLITSPLLIFLSLLVKITSKGTIFYFQERVSLAGKKFGMIKFRSMIADAEKNTGAVFVTENDSRYTTLGKFLRKFSFDELPQFINVLNGDMSIVGPRPERQYFINIMKDKIPKYLERHRVKCGITGWAQVNGLRGSNSSLEKRIEYDIYYIENWSIIFDLKIILKTIKEMFFSKAAF